MDRIKYNCKPQLISNTNTTTKFISKNKPTNVKILRGLKEVLFYQKLG